MPLPCQNMSSESVTSGHHRTTDTLSDLYFFFSSRRRHTRSDRDWSSDVCSSDLIADCGGDNAGDSVGPTADGFETYGVTGVALIAFLALALAASPAIAATLIIWLFVMRSLMIVTSLVSYFINEAISKAMFASKKDFDFEAPLTHLVWITSAVSIAVTFIASKLLLGDFTDAAGQPQTAVWWGLSVIIRC